MDKNTREYRRHQLAKVKYDNSGYAIKIKLIDINGSTNCLDITRKEFGQIKRLLTK